MFKYLSIIITLVYGAHIALAQSTSTDTTKAKQFNASRSTITFPDHTYKKYNLGIAAGITSGNGFSYRRWNDAGNGIQFTFAPFLTVEPQKKQVYLNLGLIRTHIFKDFKAKIHTDNLYRGTNLFYYYGGNYTYEYEEFNEDVYASEIDSMGMYIGTKLFKTRGNTESHGFALGAGLGTELHLWIFNWSLMAGYAGMRKWEKSSGIFYDWNGQSQDDLGVKRETRFHPSVESAIYVCF